jgi:predicted nucleic acid-binding protein
MNSERLADGYGLDTSVLAAALMPGTINHLAASAFLRTLASRKSPVYLSAMARIELIESARKIGADPRELDQAVRDRFRLRRWHTREDVRVAWSRHVLDELDRLLAEFAEAHERPITLPIIGRTVALVNHYKLKSYDALHVATAEEAGIRRFAAVDGDFAKVTHLEIEIIRD